MKKLMMVMVAGTALAASADVIHFASGDKLTGKMKSVVGNSIVFASDAVGELTVDAAKVAKMVVDAESEILYKDENREKTRIVYENGKYSALDNAGNPTRTIDIASVKQINPEVEKWHGSVNIGASAMRGNTVSETASVIANVNRRWEDYRFTADGGYYFAQSGSSKDNKQKTENRAELSAQGDYFWSKKAYMYLNGKYETDHINDLAHRYRIGGGLGYQWLDGNVFESTGKWSFSQEAGVEYVKERYDNDVGGADDDNFAAFRYAHHLKWIPSFVQKNVEVFHNLEYHPDTAYWADVYTIDADAGISTTVFAGWSLLAKVEWDYNSRPSVGRKSSDTRYIVGLGYKW